MIGAGTIGLSFAALHLTKNPSCTVTIFDTRPDLQDYVQQHLPGYLVDTDQSACLARLSFASDLGKAVEDATIVQEQGPENPDFKTSIWPQIEANASADALLWSSTSGIPASVQNQQMRDRTRLLVVHPYNPPHIMPLLELVPSPTTSPRHIERTVSYWRALGRSPVVLKKECPGFVANRLAFALFREACSLVHQGVVDVAELDEIVQASMGPRWTVAGPFAAYHAGGGKEGLSGFMEKIGGTVQGCWKAGEEGVKSGGIVVGGEWQGGLCRRTEEVYGVVDTRLRDERTRRVLKAVGRS